MVRKILDKTLQYAFYVSFLATFLMMVITVIDVIGRFFNHPLVGAVEVVILMLVVSCAFSWAYVQSKKGHITIDLILNVLPARAQNILNIVMSVLGLILMCLIAWQSVNMIMLSYRVKEWTALLQLPVWIFKISILVGCTLLGLQLILDIIDYSKKQEGKFTNVDIT